MDRSETWQSKPFLLMQNRKNTTTLKMANMNEWGRSTWENCPLPISQPTLNWDNDNMSPRKASSSSLVTVTSRGSLLECDTFSMTTHENLETTSLWLTNKTASTTMTQQENQNWWPMWTSFRIFWSICRVRYPQWHLLWLWRNKIANSMDQVSNMP